MSLCLWSLSRCFLWSSLNPLVSRPADIRYCNLYFQFSFFYARTLMYISCCVCVNRLNRCRDQACLSPGLACFSCMPPDIPVPKVHCSSLLPCSIASTTLHPAFTQNGTVWIQKPKPSVSDSYIPRFSATWAPPAAMKLTFPSCRTPAMTWRTSAISSSVKHITFIAFWKEQW